MAFVPGIATTATEGLAFAVSGQDLHVVRRDGAAAPEIPRAAVDADAIFLGELDGAPCFAVHVGDDDAPPPGTTNVGLRQLFGALPDETFGVAARALGVLAWDRDHRFCGRCGSPTARSPAERARVCASCAFAAYPRLSPAVIMLIERDGKALLGRNARFPRPFFSTLAGFVEVGETLEQTVIRETREEAGIEVTDIRYFGSQPWPFTGSLMIGFTARWAAGELAPDPAELAEAGWFAPDALPLVPPKLSIARELIDDFVRRHGAPDL